MRLVRVLALASAVLPAAFATEASAKNWWTLDFLFEDRVNEAREYDFYDDPMVVEDELDDEDTRVSSRRFAEDPYEFDENYYEPKVKSRPSLKERMKAQKAVKSKVQTTTRKLPDVKVASANDADVLPEKPKKKAAAPAQVKSVSCNKAATIVGGYGFSGVKSKTCEGKVMVFTATRSGKNYEVSVSSANGELTEVKRL
jgi:hypothetical protein